MIITEFDNPLTAEDARKIALNNRDDSADRHRFRDLMQSIKEVSSRGYTRFVTSPENKDLLPSDYVQKALRSMGYRVIEKRAMKWDDDKKEWSDRPMLDNSGRDQFFLEITWG